MSSSLKYRLLDAMGVTYWIPRQSSVITSSNPLLCAACLVLLPEKISNQESEQHKILLGMLKVLDLNAEELCIGWLHNFQGLDPYFSIGQAIAKWAPYSVLIMGERLAQRLLNAHKPLDELRKNSQSIADLNACVYVTYHPQELEKVPQHKRRAYEDLLNLKARISQARAK